MFREVYPICVVSLTYIVVINMISFMRLQLCPHHPLLHCQLKPPALGGWRHRPAIHRSTSRNVHIHDDFLVTLHLFIMEVVSTVTNFVTSSQITSDGSRPLKIMTKLGRSSQNNKLVCHR
jgi:hypothetical protein